jgi:putative tricarboxylic transport membrane protein
MYIPKDVSDETFNLWAERLQKVADSDEWKAAMEANGLAPFTKIGADFQGYVDQVVDEVKELSQDLGVIN